MVKLIIDNNNNTVIFEIKNNGINDLKNFYTIDYFNFVNITYEIFVSTSSTGNYVDRLLNVPFKQFTNYAKNGMKIKSKSSMELLKQLNESNVNLQTSYKNETIIIKIKIEKDLIYSFQYHSNIFLYFP